MGKYQAYPEYKDSGVEWIGDSPAEWEVLDGKRLFKNVRIPAFADDKQLAASQKYGVIPQDLMMQLNDSKVMLALKGTESFKHVDNDDFVISLRSFEGGIEHSKYAGCVSPAYTVLRANRALAPSYYRYLFKSKPYISALQSSTDSLRDGKSITYDQFGLIKLIIPSITEQQKIAAFLDHETAKIDALIEKQQQLIQLLKEKRQAVISHAVTKGLNPNAPMKDSGIEWLGEVPAHWDVIKINHMARVLNGSTPDKTNPDFWTDGNIPWVSSSCLNQRRIERPTDFITEQAFKQSSVEMIPKGSLLVGMVGQGKTRGESAVLEIDSCINQNLAAIIPSDRISINYLSYVFNCIYEDLRELGRGGNQPALNCEIVGSLRIPVPPKSEQKLVEQWLSKVIDKIDKIILMASSQIELMQERRTALISAAVTGKIDVRHFAEPATR